MAEQHTQLWFPELINLETVARLPGVGERNVRSLVGGQQRNGGFRT